MSEAREHGAVEDESSKRNEPWAEAMLDNAIFTDVGKKSEECDAMRDAVERLQAASC